MPAAAEPETTDFVKKGPDLERKHMKRIYVKSSQTLGLNLPSEDRELIKDIYFSDSETERKIHETDPNDPMVQLTLEDLDLLAGDVAAEANHCEEKKRQKKLRAVFGRISWLLERYTDDKEEAQKEEPAVTDDPYELLVQVMGLSGLGGVVDKVPEAFKNKLRVEMKFALGQISREDYLKQTRKTLLKQTDTVALTVTDRQRSALLEHLALSDTLRERLRNKPDRKFSLAMTPPELNELRDSLEAALKGMKGNLHTMLNRVLWSIREIYEKHITAEFQKGKGGKIWF